METETNTRASLREQKEQGEEPKTNTYAAVTEVISNPQPPAAFDLTNPYLTVQDLLAEIGKNQGVVWDKEANAVYYKGIKLCNTSESGFLLDINKELIEEKILVNKSSLKAEIRKRFSGYITIISQLSEQPSYNSIQQQEAKSMLKRKGEAGYYCLIPFHIPLHFVMLHLTQTYPEYLIEATIFKFKNNEICQLRADQERSFSSLDEAIQVQSDKFKFKEITVQEIKKDKKLNEQLQWKNKQYLLYKSIVIAKTHKNGVILGKNDKPLATKIDKFQDAVTSLVNHYNQLIEDLKPLLENLSAEQNKPNYITDHPLEDISTIKHLLLVEKNPGEFILQPSPEPLSLQMLYKGKSGSANVVTIQLTQGKFQFMENQFSTIEEATSFIIEKFVERKETIKNQTTKIKDLLMHEKQERKVPLGQLKINQQTREAWKVSCEDGTFNITRTALDASKIEYINFQIEIIGKDEAKIVILEKTEFFEDLSFLLVSLQQIKTLENYEDVLRILVAELLNKKMQDPKTNEIYQFEWKNDYYEINKSAAENTENQQFLRFKIREDMTIEIIQENKEEKNAEETMDPKESPLYALHLLLLMRNFVDINKLHADIIRLVNELKDCHRSDKELDYIYHLNLSQDIYSVEFSTIDDISNIKKLSSSFKIENGKVQLLEKDEAKNEIEQLLELHDQLFKISCFPEIPSSPSCLVM